MGKAFRVCLIAATVGLSGCDDTEERIQALIKQTEENMVFVKGGTFMMGDPGCWVADRECLKDEDGEYYLGSRADKPDPEQYPDIRLLPMSSRPDDGPPQIEVTVGDFYISKYEVTYAEHDLYRKVKGLEKGKYDTWLKGEERDRMPIMLSWQKAKDYCVWLAEITGKSYDLPTEEQWEFAATSRGKSVLFATDNGKGEKGRNYGRNPKPNDVSYQRIALYSPNPLGLYDMTANVDEWTESSYNPNLHQRWIYISEEEKAKPIKKVARGGHSSYDNGLGGLFIFSKHAKPQNYISGFRCILNP